MNLTGLFLLIPLVMAFFADAPDCDEPDTFPPLEEMCDGKVWGYVETVYYGSNGQELRDHYISCVGKSYGLIFMVQDNTLIRFARNNGDEMKWAALLMYYEFDRKTGNINITSPYAAYTLQKPGRPFAQIISYDKDSETIVLHTNYDEWIIKGQLEGYDKNNVEYDVGSYGRLVMKPVTDKAYLDEMLTTSKYVDIRDMPLPVKK